MNRSQKKAFQVKVLTATVCVLMPTAVTAVNFIYPATEPADNTTLAALTLASMLWVCCFGVYHLYFRLRSVDASRRILLAVTDEGALTVVVSARFFPHWCRWRNYLDIMSRRDRTAEWESVTSIMLADFLQAHAAAMRHACHPDRIAVLIKEKFSDWLRNKLPPVGLRMTDLTCEVSPGLLLDR